MNTLLRKNKMIPSLLFKCKGCVHILFQKIFAPSKNLIGEDEKRRGLLLNIILVGVLGVLTVLTLCMIILLVTGKYAGMPPLMFISLCIIFAFLFLVSKAGYANLASGLFIIFYFSASFYCAYKWGIDVPIALLGAMTLIIMSGILIDSRFALLISILIGISHVTIGYLQIKGIINPDNAWHTNGLRVDDLIEQPIIFLLVTVVVWISNRELEKSLARARASEQELKKERDELEVTVEQRTREVREAQAEKISHLYRFAEFGRLSSGIFHDLMNPLTAVSLNLHEVSNDPSKLTETKQYLQKALDASHKMERFIKTVRKQIQTHESECFFFIHQEMREALELLVYKARRKNVHLLPLPSSDISLFGNPIFFNQIILNLVSNAIDAYDTEDGSEEIADPERTVGIHISTKSDTKNQEMLIITVTDRGCGIAPQIKGRIFDPFFTTKSAHKGTGIGLSQTKYLVEKYFHGQIAVESTTDRKKRGSVFTIELPIKRAQ